jgi:hypothetical protein
MIRKIDRTTGQLVVVKEKYCSRKKHTLAVTEFNGADGTADGLQNWCRHCQREYNAQYLAAKRNSSEVSA